MEREREREGGGGKEGGSERGRERGGRESFQSCIVNNINFNAEIPQPI